MSARKKLYNKRMRKNLLGAGLLLSGILFISCLGNETIQSISETELFSLPYGNFEEQLSVSDINEVGNVSATYKDEPLAAKKIFFFEDLLLKKVFAEDGLASPMKTKIHQSNKSILVAKISTAAFVVIGSYGLFSANDNLKSSKNSLYSKYPLL